MSDHLLPSLELAVELGALDGISGIAPDDLLLLTPWVQTRDVLALPMALAQIRGKLNMDAPVLRRRLLAARHIGGHGASRESGSAVGRCVRPLVLALALQLFNYESTIYV